MTTNYSTNGFELNSQQEAAVEAVLEWYRGWADRRHRKQVFFLAGWAGVGKTAVAKLIAGLCAPIHRVVFVAPTGKAASRLRQKGCKGAKTMHQFIYNVRGEDDEGDPIFVGKGALDEQPLLVVFDEGSMLGEYDARQLLSHGIPILMLGDTGQLEPVKAVAAYTEKNVDFMLTEIMRQGKESNIIRASMFVRDGKRLPIREYDDVHVRAGEISLDDLLKHATEDGQILCSYNATRKRINAKVRKALGYEGDMPQVGEKIVCKFNQHGYGFMNGEQGILLSYESVPDYEREDDDEHGLMVRIKSLTDGKERTVKFNPLSFDRDEEVAKTAQKTTGGFDYGWCLTIHSAQGSEWPRVLVIEELMRGANYAKTMYTGITRAQEELTIYREG